MRHNFKETCSVEQPNSVLYALWVEDAQCYKSKKIKGESSYLDHLCVEIDPQTSF
jgi:hypothetical protein